MRSLALALALLVAQGTAKAEGPAPTQEPGAANKASRPSVKMPLTIVENQGQTDPRVKFYLSGGRGTVFFTPDEVVFKLVEPRKADKAEGDGAASLLAPQRGVVVRMSFPGANPSARIEGIDPLPGRVNDFRGNDSTQWHKDIRTFGGVAYRDLYPGVDLEYRTGTGDLKRVLVVHDRAHLGEVRFQYAGTDAVRLNAQGVLELVTAIGTIREEPLAAIDAQTPPRTEALKYAVLGKDTVGVNP